MEVVAAADDAFAFPLAVLASMLASVDPEEVHLTVLTGPDTSTTLVERAKRVANGRLSIDLQRIDPGRVSGLEVRTTHISPATFFRLFAPEFIDGDRALYLDCDLLIRRSLRDLWSADLCGRPLGAVQNLGCPYVASRWGLRSWHERDLDPRTPYFNAGVLVMDLKEWRGRGHAEAVLDIARSAHEAHEDQGALNAHFAGRWQELDLRWNQHPLVYDDALGLETIVDPQVLEQAREDPWIVHFMYSTKPWHRVCTHPRAADWRAAAAEVDPAWRPSPPSRGGTLKRRLAKARHALVHG